jgi:hypothetical protein
MSSAMSHVHKGFGVVRPYLHGPVHLPEFLQRTFNAVELEHNEDGPTLLPGRFAPESPAGFVRNRWPISAEYAI